MATVNSLGVRSLLDPTPDTMAFMMSLLYSVTSLTTPFIQKFWDALSVMLSDLQGLRDLQLIDAKPYLSTLKLIKPS